MLYVTIPLGSSLTQIAYGPGSLGTLIGNVVGFAIVIGAVFTLIWMLLGGLSWITAGGDKAKVEEARDRITQALIGFVLVMATWAIWNLVTGRFFGLDLTSGASGDLGGTGQSLPAANLIGDPSRKFDNGACASKCSQVHSGCTGAIDRPQKNEFGIPYCECVPPPNFTWVQVDQNPYDHCQPI